MKKSQYLNDDGTFKGGCVVANRALPIAYNRDGIDNGGWIHIVPKGELPNKESGIIQVLDEKALATIVANLRADQTRLGNRWPGLYMGEEHFIYDPEKSSQAFMWAKEFDQRDDGIWARGDITDVGEPAIKNKRFKFTSFVTDPAVPGSVEHIEGDKFRILRIDTVGFTNYANGRHLLRPVTNRNDSTDPARAGSAGNPNTKTERTPTMKTIASKLGLSAEASEDAILGEVIKLQNRVTELAPHETENKKLTNRLEEVESELVDGLMVEFGVKEEKTQKSLKPVLVKMKNREERVSFLTDCKFKPVDPKDAKGGKVLNRAAAATPADKGEVEEGDEQAKTVKITNRAHELKGQNSSRTFESCWNQAMNESQPKK